MCHWSKPLGAVGGCPVSLPPYYGGVILVGVASFGMHVFLARRVMSARKQFNLPCPTMYHPTSEEFNCIQRAHQGYLETLPIFLMGLFVGGLYCPVGATTLGSIYLLGRFCYYKGYTSGNPEDRKKGRFSCFALMLMMVSNAFFGCAHLYASFKGASSCCPRLKH